MSKIRKGQQIRIKPQWQDAGDQEFTWFAIEDEDGGRVKISPVIPSLSFPPVSVVDVRMIESCES